MSISSRRHDFQPLSTYFKITSCDVCHGGINFAAKPAYKCRDCLQLAHVSCSPRLILPCVPRTLVFTRTPSRRGQPVYHLQEFCPSLPPMIAYPVIYCIVDLENRGLGREGIYRVPGRKDHDPLVPKSSREEFIRAAQTNNIMSLNVAICDLPQPNRDTLAYLMLHLQKVATLKELNQMTFQKIARCMAVPIMGQGSYRRGDIKVPSDDAGGKVRSVLQMLKMSSEYWLQFLEYEECHKKSIGGSGTPAASSAPCEPFSANKSMLGTVTVPHAARSALKHTARREQEFFDSTQ
uniref:Phorbol-ester/DAG-type domain-containing protein n=1 Tax=Angiostrongylus cantonensis TaxID=6313 RepID=A0A0K0DPZ1_ANGCA